MMPKVIKMVLFQGGGKHEGIERILNYEKAQKTLLNKLKKEGVNEDNLVVVVSEVCNHLIEEMGENTILNSTPELLIRHDYNHN
jgi:fatty acid-binding protein DegV